ncbi:MAG TPA: peptidoglycan DD-metalloendopeptidase family protein [Holophagaceae bacterium]|nr:peptidoglycan DD-metalloendopeptidase family protein [Holophagaceae bacterium]
MRAPASLVLILSAGTALAATPPFRPSPVPGGVALVSLPGAEPREARFNGERVLLWRQGDGWAAVVGIPLSAKPGTAFLNVDGRKVAFTIHPARYPVQRITLKNPHQVNPDPEELARIAREQALMAPVWEAWPEGLATDLRFRQPTPGRLTSSFGLRRIFNGEARAPHSGLDIAAPAGQDVQAPADGTVMLTGDFFFSGNTVLIAHGEGVVSLLCHLQDLAVRQGQRVKAGDLIGHVGMTGRATGPHLHWSLSLNDARVDPRLFLHGAAAR